MPLKLLSGLFDKPWPFVVDQVPVRLVVEIDPACPCSASSPVAIRRVPPENWQTTVIVLVQAIPIFTVHLMLNGLILNSQPVVFSPLGQMVTGKMHKASALIAGRQ